MRMHKDVLIVPGHIIMIPLQSTFASSVLGTVHTLIPLILQQTHVRYYYHPPVAEEKPSVNHSFNYFTSHL